MFSAELFSPSKCFYVSHNLLASIYPWKNVQPEVKVVLASTEICLDLYYFEDLNI